MDQFAPNDVDFIIVDEFHHATAATYRLLIGYSAPKFLFGQTATPGRSILASCHARKIIRTIPAVCARLVTALFLDSGYTDEKETARKGHALGQDIQPPPKKGAIQLLYMHCYPCCKNHHQKVKKIAAVTGSSFLSIIPQVANHFIQAELRHFDYGDKDAALNWLKADK